MRRSRSAIPRPLVAGIGRDSPEIECLDVFTSLVRSRFGQDLHLADYDLVVAFNHHADGAAGPAVIFGDPSGQRLRRSPDLTLNAVELRDGYEIRDEWLGVCAGEAGRKSLHSEVMGPDEWRELVKDTIETGAADHWETTRPLSVDHWVHIDAIGRYEPDDIVSWTSHGLESKVLEPLFVLNDGSVLAALSRTPEGHPLLLLPSWTPNKRAWLRLAWKVWVVQGHMNTPGPPDGFDEAAWMTAAELDIHTSISAKQAELDDVTHHLNGEIKALNAELESAKSDALGGHRRLLIESGEGLVDAVGEAFKVLGFKVTDMDAIHAEKREDLRAADPSADWIALVEVKGYSKGGKANDFLRFAKFQRLFNLEERRPQDACWYVVNAYLEHPPAVRAAAFASSQDAVRAFSESSEGLVIPTTELFQLVRDVEAGTCSAAEARDCLTSAELTYVYTSRESARAEPIQEV